ncbi:MAG TPA: DUF4340 domain-containing protein [Burkholderiales bacterium]|nr:DUF4340 domain-containing protein [Burkholderiales bacterium]
MKSKVLVNLVLVLLLTGLVLYAFFRPKEQSDPGIRLTQLKRDDITRITVERRGSPTIQLEKRDGGWRISAPLQTRADPIQVERLADLTTATAKHKLPPGDPGRYQLDPPQVRLTLNDQAFAFGRINDVTNEQYVATAGAIYLVAPFFGYGIPTEVGKLVSRKLLDDAEVPIAFDFGRYRIARDERGTWTIEGVSTERQGKALSQDDFNRWADEWRFTSSLGAEPRRGARGREHLVVHFRDGKKVAMEIVQKQPEFLLVRSDENMQYRFGAEVGRRLLDPHVVAEK